MKLSYSWLQDYLKCSLTPAQIAEAMTSIGIEVDSLEETEAVPGGLNGVVVAKVLTCDPHPDSDHLHPCIGRQILNHRATREVLPYYIFNVSTVSSDTIFFILDIG